MKPAIPKGVRIYESPEGHVYLSLADLVQRLLKAEENYRDEKIDAEKRGKK